MKEIRSTSPASTLRRKVVGSTLAGTAIAATAGTAAILAPASGAFAQSAYPDRPIKVVVPFPPGALTDNLGRAVAEKLRGLGQPILVENRPGAGTLVAAEQVKKAPADGYTLLVATISTLGISPALYSKANLTYRDFSGVAMIGTVTFFLVANPAFPANDPRELAAALRAKPGGYNYASPGNGTVHHLLTEMFKQMEKVDAQHVPYQGSVQAVTDLVSGRVDFMFLDATAAVPQIRAGKLKALAVNGKVRHPLSPNTPTIAEFFPGFDLQAWQSVAAPLGTPPEIVGKLNAEINKALGSPEFRAQLTQMGVDATPMSVAELNALYARDATRLAELVKLSGARVD